MSESDPKAQIRALLQEGMQAARKGDRAHADTLFQAVLEKDPDHEEALLWRAALAEDPDQSAVHLQRALTINPDNTRAQSGLRWARGRIQASKGTRWHWWHVVGLIAALLLTGVLGWWATPRIFRFVGLTGPEATATESVLTARSPATDVPLLAMATAIPTVTSSPLPPRATAVPTMTPSSPPLVATATRTARPSVAPALATTSPTLSASPTLSGPTPTPVPPTATPTPTDTPTNTPTPVPPTATPPLLPGLSWEAEDGTISAPFTVADGYVSQSIWVDDPSSGGRASYWFIITTPGNYVVKAVVDAPNDGSDSFFVNVDSEPVGPAMIWDIDLTSGFEERSVSWRGSDTYDAGDFAFKVFSLSAGEHELIIRGREGHTRLDRVAVEAFLTVTPTPMATLAAIPSFTPSCEQIYVVRRGDSLISIARRFGTAEAAIMEANGIVDPDFIWVGQRLIIPLDGTAMPTSMLPTECEVIHVVQRGETLTAIAWGYGTTVEAILLANGLVNPNSIWVGQRLIISSCGTPTPTSTPRARPPQTTPLVTTSPQSDDLGQSPRGEVPTEPPNR